MTAYFLGAPFSCLLEEKMCFLSKPLYKIVWNGILVSNSDTQHFFEGLQCPKCFGIRVVQ